VTLRLCHCVFLLGLSGVAHGTVREVQGAVARADAVEIKLWSVHASSQGDEVDPRLSPIAKHLKRMNFTNFELLSEQGADMLDEDRKRFQLVGGRTVQVSLLSHDDQRVRVRVRIGGSASEILDTTVSIQRNSFLMVAGPKYEDGMLVLPIFARY